VGQVRVVGESAENPLAGGIIICHTFQTSCCAEPLVGGDGSRRGLLFLFWIDSLLALRAPLCWECSPSKGTGVMSAVFPRSPGGRTIY